MALFSRRDFIEHLTAVAGVCRLVDYSALSKLPDETQSWCLGQELAVARMQERLRSIRNASRLDEGLQNSLQQEILVAPPTWFIKTERRGIYWAAERLERSFRRSFYALNSDWFRRICLEFFSNGGCVAGWIERNLVSIPDWYLHPLSSRVTFNEARPRREVSSDPRKLATQTVRFGHGRSGFSISLKGVKLGYLPGTPKIKLSLYQQTIPREYEGPGLRRQEYLEYRHLVADEGMHLFEQQGEIGFHVIPAEQKWLREEVVLGRSVKVWNMRFITLGQLRSDGMCAMLGLGFCPENGELVSIRPCYLPFSVVSISIPNLLPMLNRALPLN